MIALPIHPNAAPARHAPLACVSRRRPDAEPVVEAEDGTAYPVPPEQRRGPLWRALEEVMDPEIPISLVDLGLIYDLRRSGGVVEVDLTFTATACPCVSFIRFDIEERLLREPEVEEVRIREVWSPAWTKARISPQGRERLREMGVSM